MSAEPTHPDLFSEEDTPVKPPAQGHIQQRKKRLGYSPDGGDPEQRCGNCRHLIKRTYHGRNYYKCALIGISHSEATDIRLAGRCKRWEHESNPDNHHG